MIRSFFGKCFLTEDCLIVRDSSLLLYYLYLKYIKHNSKYVKQDDCYCDLALHK